MRDTWGCSHRNMKEAEILNNLNSPQPIFGFCIAARAAWHWQEVRNEINFNVQLHHKANVKCSPCHTSHLFDSSTKENILQTNRHRISSLFLGNKEFFYTYVYIFFNSHFL